jgi:hypothetical protein
MPSNLVNAALLIRRGLFDNLYSFSELEQRISALAMKIQKSSATHSKSSSKLFLRPTRKCRRRLSG